VQFFHRKSTEIAENNYHNIDPRLAIVYGLLLCPKGPLNVDRSNSDFPDLFLPFKNLLRKIRELLQVSAARWYL
jgi:hypothetical protein